MQVDPLAVSEEATYQYAGNNPVFFNDPFGGWKDSFEKTVQRLMDSPYGGTDGWFKCCGQTVGWTLGPKMFSVFRLLPTTWQKNRSFISDIKIKEAGYIFVFLSYDNTQSTNYVYFDDLNITLTKSNVIQYNDYYPFDRKHPQAGHATTTATVFSTMPATS